MATIEEYSDEPKYTIKAVSGQTGIRPVTLRAWERRHEVLSPHRSDNRYRLYSDRDVAILRWLKSRVDQEVSISAAVSELRSLRTTGFWPEAVPSIPAQHLQESRLTPDEYAAQLYQALIRRDEAGAGQVFLEMHTAFDLMTLFERVIVPTLVKIGEGWFRGELSVATEHFSSAYLRGKLLTLLQAYPIRRSAAHVLIGCGPDEQHEIGSLMLAVLLRADGFRVEYLGPDIPLDDLVDYAGDERPDMVILSATTEPAARLLGTLQGKLNRLRRPVLFGFGGGAFNANPRLRAEIPGVFLGVTLEHSLTRARDLLATKKPN